MIQGSPDLVSTGQRAGAVIRLAIVNDYELVVAGVAAMLSDERHRIQVTSLDPTTRDLGRVDVVLYDTFGPSDNSMDYLADLVGRGQAPVIVYSWKQHPRLVRHAVRRGASGYLSKALSGPEIAEAVQAVARGEVVISPGTDLEAARDRGDWPGRQAGLSAREAEIVAMIATGLTNQEIAERSYLSINSVKSYVRTAYKKIGAERRAQAVRWALENGFGPTPDTSAPTETAQH